MRRMKVAGPIMVAFAALVVLAGSASPATAQDREAQDWLDRCRAGDSRFGDSREVFCEVREVRLPADGRRLTVDGRQNGGVTVEGWDRREILVQALIAVGGDTEAEARSRAESVRIHTADGVVRAEAPGEGRRSSWSVSYRVYVPRQTDLELRAHNGGLRVRDVSGRLDLETHNGGISLAGVAGDVRARTRNGGLNVRLEGSRWEGAGLDARTTNGGISLSIPEAYSARIQTGTVNGRVHTDIPITVQGELRRDLSFDLGGGGAPVQARTTNGSVRILRL